MGVQHNFYSLFLPRAAQSTTRLTEAELRGANATTQEQEEWVQLDHNLKYVLIITTTGAAATLCSQFSTGHRTWDLQTTKHTIQNTNRNKKHWLPNQTARANVWHQQFWRIIWQLGIWDTTIRIRQQHKFTRSSQSGSSDEQKQDDHCNNIYISMQEHPQHMRRYGQQSLNTKEHIQPSAGYNRIHHQQFHQTIMEEQHQWT